MNSAVKNLAILALLLVCATLGTLAWRQQSRLRLLGRQLAASTEEQKKLQQRAAQIEQRLVAAEKRRTDPGTGATRTGGGPVPLPGPVAGVTNRRFGPGAGDPGRGIDSPDFQKAMAASMRSTLDQRYATLFRKLKLNPGELERLKDLLVDRQAISMDVMRAAAAQGLNMIENGEDIGAMMEKVQAGIDGDVRDLLGDQRYSHYQDFNQHAGSYTLLDQIERRLSYTATPLQESQADQLLRILASTAPAATDDRRAGVFMAFGGGPVSLMGGQPPITDETVARAQTVLSPSQVEALKQLQAEQQSQASMFRAARVDMAFGPAAAGATVTIPVPSPATAPASSTATLRPGGP
ncbi:MAG: hypothetical protein A3G75_06345 [Verrucomicrobia bacterium RIFCSPLOWO2_12_FULL_64_8]|nr:MAG: hypothetical protein A3G75_06345 [Verrucomicrobia bacterium RIFCSPLOWO2_12_FULL_64_8]